MIRFCLCPTDSADDTIYGKKRNEAQPRISLEPVTMIRTIAFINVVHAVVVHRSPRDCSPIRPCWLDLEELDLMLRWRAVRELLYSHEDHEISV